MFLFTILIWIALSTKVELVLVRVEQGLLRGEIRRRVTGNGQFCSFRGIPYAAPPVGELRFKAPRPALKWSGERLALAHGPVCPQIEFGTGRLILGNEDCLYINVYTPTTNMNASLPVMVFMHGGGHVSGSGNEDEYGPDFLLDQDVVLVTFNYRLGPLGFLSLEIKEAPGNAAMKDQVEALRWVNKNIAQFGGDPDMVTIFGQSAGGTSVSFHVLSPMSKGLFKRAIIQSATCFHDIAVAFEPKQQGLLLAHRLGLYTENPQEAFSFLQNASVEALVTGKPNLLARGQLHQYVWKYHSFPPVVEKDFGDQRFMVEKPELLLLRGKTNINEIIIGNTAEEGVTRAVSQREYIFETWPYYKEMFVPYIIYIQKSPERALELADSIKNYYFQGKEVSETNMKEFIHYFSYAVYVTGVHRYLEMWKKSGNRAYLYEFSCFSERNVYGRTGIKYGVRQASHRDDLMYLFDAKKYGLPINKNSSSYDMIVQTCTLYANYAKYGNPTPDWKTLGVKWKHYNRNQSVLNIDLNLTSKRANLTEIEFWRRLYLSEGVLFS